MIPKKFLPVANKKLRSNERYCCQLDISICIKLVFNWMIVFLMCLVALNLFFPETP